MMPDERRLSIRKTPEHLSYLSLPSDNGGIVLDISEGGLRFQAIAPVEADGPIHFRFSIDSATRIKAIGELAWKDDSGKIGGLRFIQLPDETREQIRVWAGQSKKSSRGTQFDNPFDESVAVQASEAGVEVQPGPGSKGDSVTIAESAHPLLYSLRPPIYSAPFYNLSMFPPALGSEVGAASAALKQRAPVRDDTRENMQVSAVYSRISGVGSMVAEPGTAEEAIPGYESEWESLASDKNPLPHNLEAAIQSAPSYAIPMSPQEMESEARGGDVAVRPPVALRHPVAAMGLTIALALLVSLGICAYVATSKVGESFLNWGGRLLRGSSSQPILRYPAPAVNSVSHSVRIVRR
jgi:hypothetical protein